jgi:hypothetical protein
MPGDGVLACSDRLLRVVRPRAPSGADLHLEHRLSSVATALAPYGPRHSDGSARLAFGTSGGGLGLVAVHEGRVETLVEIEEEGSSGVSSVTVADLTGDGVLELVVARDDGTMQVVRVEDGGKALRTVFEGDVGEAVRGVACGQVTNQAGFDGIGRPLCDDMGGTVLVLR